MKAAAPELRSSGYENTSGTGTLLRFALRRERFWLPWWLFGIGVLLALQSTTSQRFYHDPGKLAQLRETMSGNAAAVAMGGPTRLLDTIGGEVLFEVFAYLAIVTALMNMFLIGRHTRTDEETGRAELIRSARVGRRATAVAALGVAAVADIAVALVVFAVAVATDLPVGGSLLLGAAIAGVGFTFAALTTVAAQIFENPRSVYGSTALALAAAYMLRAIGDVGDGAAAWASPIGWGQRTYPYVEDRWWPILLFAAASAALITLAFALLERRDFGAGLLTYGTGRATASWALSSPLGLAWRLQRSSLFGWAAGVFGLGAAYGSFADSIEEYLADNPDLAAFFPGGVQDAVDSYLALTISVSALLAAAYGITAVLRARTEETAGRAESVLAAPVSRSAWFSGHFTIALAGSALVLAAGGFGEGMTHSLAVSDPGQLFRVTGVALAYLPATSVVVSLAALAVGWLPRAATPVAWAGFAYVTVALLFTDSFDLPAWSDDASPFRHTPRAPLESITVAPILVLLGIAAVIAVVAFTGLRRRDVGA